MTGLVLLCVAVSLTLLVGLAHRRRDGRLRTAATTASPEQDAGLRAVLDELGEIPGERATLIQFSSAFCAPCRATRRILGEVADMVDGVAHVEVDAEQHLDLVRRLGIVKTPTTLVLDAGTVEVKRASGQPRKADVLAALGHALP